MSTWSPADTIAMEKRHVAEGEQRVARQDVIVSYHLKQGHDSIVVRSLELLAILRQSVELSHERLRYLEQRYGSAPDH